jgi:hypothetical protein
MHNNEHSEILFEVLDLDTVDESWLGIGENEYGIAGGDEIETSKLGLLRFADQLPAVCYSHGISFKALQQQFPQVFSAKYHYDQVKGESWPTYENLVLKNYDGVSKEVLAEVLDQSQWSWHDVKQTDQNYYDGHHNQYFSNFTIQDQVDFIVDNCQFIPQKVLEIGGGRGEIANVFKKLGIDCISLEPGKHADFIYNYTGKFFFGKDFESATPTKNDFKTLIQNNEIDQFDTIIFCQTIEHIAESDFWEFWNKLVSNFNGLVIIVSYVHYHPIEVVLPQHVFGINDEVYDRLVNDSKRCVFRDHSHLVLQL